MTALKEVRLGVVGVGSMGSWHARSVLDGLIPRCRLTAVCDILPEARDQFESVRKFSDPGEMFRSGTVDAIILATPHYLHTTVGIVALESGLHVLTEKPMAVHKADAERMLAAHKGRKTVFGIMFQLRTEPLWMKVRQLVHTGELGRISRINWTVTDWFRTEAYYASGSWRASWKGEGGGILVNQCVHNLDLWQWILRMPVRVRAVCCFGKRHAIEVEDEVYAILEYADGAVGQFCASTCEAPGVNRWEIAGDRGLLVVEGGRINYTRNEQSADSVIRNSKHAYEAPEVWRTRVPEGGRGGGHNEVIRNFVEAILDGTPLIAPAAEGLHQIELSNAILYSSLTGKPVDLPLDSAAFEEAHASLVAKSRERTAVTARDRDEVPRYIVK